MVFISFPCAPGIFLPFSRKILPVFSGILQRYVFQRIVLIREEKLPGLYPPADAGRTGGG